MPFVFGALFERTYAAGRFHGGSENVRAPLRA